MPDSKHPVLIVEDLEVRFGQAFQAVRGIDLTIGAGESVAIIGESGSGKSVTASAIMDLLDSPPAKVRAGKMTFCGLDLMTMSRAARRALYGRGLSMIFQDSLAHLNPVYPVGWQVAEVCRIHGMGRAEASARALELLVRVGIPEPSRRYNDYPHQFSGGQRQRILIAMAVAMGPKLLIADEPTTALDVTIQAQILDLLRGLREETGMSLLMITHDLGVAADIADRVCVMHQGRFVEQGTARQVLMKPTHSYTKALLGAQPEGRARKMEGDSSAIIEATGLKLFHPVSGGRGNGPQVIKAVDGVDFRISAGEVLGVVGESGSGKSSIARMLLRLDAPTEGEILFRGKALGGLSGSALRGYRRSVQAVFQDPYTSLNPRMTVFQILTEPWVLNPDTLPRESWSEEAGRLIGQVGLKRSDLAKYPGQFSGGQCQRIAIARALALKPQVLICDEAVSALDMSIRAQIIDLLTDLRAELGLSLFFIAHDLKLVQNFADRVIVMHRGRIVEQGAAKDVLVAPSHPYTRALIAASPSSDPVEQAERRRAFHAIGKAS